MTVGWNANEEKLLALVVLDDARAARLNAKHGAKHGEAFFRAFIVQHRRTGAVEMRFRFRYRDRDVWYKAGPASDAATTLAEYLDGIQHALREAAEWMGETLEPGDITPFYPPDDEGDWERTIGWLQERDLIQVTHRTLEETCLRKPN
jgi:hypothetical protein